MVIISAEGREILVSDTDYEKARNYKWNAYIEKNGHARTVTFVYGKKTKKVSISALVFGINTKTHAIYHKNGNYFDYRRENIIICTRSELTHLLSPRCPEKTSKYTGIYYHSQTGKWMVSVMKGDSKRYGGYYSFEEEAAIVAEYILRCKYGDIAVKNFPEKTFDEIKASYELIEKKYGPMGSERISRGNQGKKKNDNRNKYSQYVGVTRTKTNQRWLAQIRFKNKNMYIGYFDTEIAAAKAYDEKAVEIYGEYARLNFPDNRN